MDAEENMREVSLCLSSLCGLLHTDERYVVRVRSDWIADCELSEIGSSCRPELCLGADPQNGCYALFICRELVVSELSGQSVEDRSLGYSPQIRLCCPGGVIDFGLHPGELQTNDTLNAANELSAATFLKSFQHGDPPRILYLPFTLPSTPSLPPPSCSGPSSPPDNSLTEESTLVADICAMRRVPAVRLSDWPAAAKKWVSRSSGAWPAQELVLAAADRPVFAAPRTALLQNDGDRQCGGADWLLDFGDVEALLEGSFGVGICRVGRLTAAPLFSLAHSPALSPAIRSTLSPWLISVLGKHSLFWTLEKGEGNVKDSPTELIHAVRNTLTSFLRARYFPHYFLPALNLLHPSLFDPALLDLCVDALPGQTDDPPTQTDPLTRPHLDRILTNSEPASNPLRVTDNNGLSTAMTLLHQLTRPDYDRNSTNPVISTQKGTGNNDSLASSESVTLLDPWIRPNNEINPYPRTSSSINPSIHYQSSSSMQLINPLTPLEPIFKSNTMTSPRSLIRHNPAALKRGMLAHCVGTVELALCQLHARLRATHSVDESIARHLGTIRRCEGALGRVGGIVERSVGALGSEQDRGADADQSGLRAALEGITCQLDASLGRLYQAKAAAFPSRRQTSAITPPKGSTTFTTPLTRPQKEFLQQYSKIVAGRSKSGTDGPARKTSSNLSQRQEVWHDAELEKEINLWLGERNREEFLRLAEYHLGRGISGAPASPACRASTALLHLAQGKPSLVVIRLKAGIGQDVKHGEFGSNELALISDMDVSLKEDDIISAATNAKQKLLTFENMILEEKVEEITKGRPFMEELVDVLRQTIDSSPFFFGSLDLSALPRDLPATLPQCIFQPLGLTQHPLACLDAPFLEKYLYALALERTGQREGALEQLKGLVEKLLERNEPRAMEGSRVSEGPRVSKGPTVFEKSGVSEEPNISEELRVSKGPRVSKEPAVSEVPRISEVPGISEAPGILEGPRISEEPRISDGPEMSERQKPKSLNTPSIAAESNAQFPSAGSSHLRQNPIVKEMLSPPIGSLNVTRDREVPACLNMLAAAYMRLGDSSAAAATLQKSAGYFRGPGNAARMTLLRLELCAAARKWAGWVGGGAAAVALLAVCLWALLN